MSIGGALKRGLTGAIAPAIFLSLVGYFGWNAVRGDHGLRSYAKREELLKEVQADLARAEADRDAWARRVAGLRSDHLDRDTLEERARAMLNLADPADIVVPYAPKDRLSP
ncbi:MAG: septum formation initiator family protein [Acetobacteraceae bacterium]|nr:septum formation initiator family protein [Acetobacteraceae bacterium]